MRVTNRVVINSICQVRFVGGYALMQSRQPWAIEIGRRGAKRALVFKVRKYEIFRMFGQRHELPTPKSFHVLNARPMPDVVWSLGQYFMDRAERCTYGS